jgi:hypothetical protein
MPDETPPSADDALPGPLSDDGQFAIDAIVDDERQLAVLRWLHDHAPVAEAEIARRVRASPVPELELGELLWLYRRLGLLRRITRPDGPYLDTTATVESVVTRATPEQGEGRRSPRMERTDRWARELG